MSKIVSKKILSLVIFFVIVLVLLFTGYRILSDGFHIKSLKIGKINIQELYLKLDNKLILDVNKLDISGYFKTPSKKSFDIESVTDNVKYGIWAISYFQKLSIKKIILDNQNEASVIYDGKQYALQFPNIEANFAIEDNDKDIRLKIINLTLKKIGFQSDGDIIYSTQSRRLGFNLIVSAIDDKSQKLYLQGITNLKVLKLKAKTSEIKNIDFLKPYFSENEEDKDLREWLFEKIKFSNLEIKSAQIQATLTKNNFLSSIIKNADIKATIKDPKISLDGSIQPIIAKTATLKLQNEKLSIGLQNPTYDDIDLEGSNVELSNFLDSTNLRIKILSKNAYYANPIKNLLKIYNIELPIDSVDSPIDVNLLISLQFLQDSSPIVSVKGQINTEQSNFSLYQTPLSAKDIKVSLDIAPEYEYVYINTTNTHYENMADLDANITLNLIQKTLQANAKIHKIHISTDNDINTMPASKHTDDVSSTQGEENIPDDTQDISSGSDNLASAYENNNTTKKPDEKKQKKFIFPTKKLTPQQLRRKIIEAIKADNEKKFTKDVFYATEETLPTLDVNLDFSNPNSIEISIPDIGISGNIQNNLYSFKANNIGKLYPYSPLLKYVNITNGSADVKTSDFKNIDFNLQLWNLDVPLYTKDGKKMSEISLLGKISPDTVTANSSDNQIALSIKGVQTKIKLKNIDFNLNEFLQSKIPAIEEMLAEDPKDPDLSYPQIEQETFFIREKRKYERTHNIEPSIINLESDNSMVAFKEYQIPLDSVNLRVQDGRLAVDATYKNGVANLDFVHKNIFIRANNFSGDFLNNAFKIDMIQGGLFTLFGVYKNETFNGKLKVQNTIFKNFAVLQNVVNLIDTVPSLIVFKNPNLGAKGYEIQKGSITFAVNKKYIGFENINLIGTSIDVDGNGIIESDTDEINMNLKISTIKNLSNILNKIPIFGYLILGNEGKISTNVIVNGTLKDPKTQVSLAEDAIKAPFNILRRAFTPIDIIIDEVKKEMNE